MSFGGVDINTIKHLDDQYKHKKVLFGNILCVTSDDNGNLVTGCIVRYYVDGTILKSWKDKYGQRITKLYNVEEAKEMFDEKLKGEYERNELERERRELGWEQREQRELERKQRELERKQREPEREESNNNNEVTNSITEKFNFGGIDMVVSSGDIPSNLKVGKMSVQGISFNNN